MYKHSKHVEQKIKQVTSVGLSLFNYRYELFNQNEISTASNLKVDIRQQWSLCALHCVFVC